MRCKACGRVIDNNMRFCTYCDHDNYPGMNKVKLKGDKNENVNNSKVYRPNNSYNNRLNTQQNAKNGGNSKNTNAKNSGCIVVAVIIFIVFTVISALLSLE